MKYHILLVCIRCIVGNRLPDGNANDCTLPYIADGKLYELEAGLLKSTTCEQVVELHLAVQIINACSTTSNYTVQCVEREITGINSSRTDVEITDFLMCHTIECVLLYC